MIPTGKQMLIVYVSLIVLLSGVFLIHDTQSKPQPIHPKACWTEPKPGTPYPPERICGDVSLAPSNAINFSDNP